jgi:hypothetical protein
MITPFVKNITDRITISGCGIANAAAMILLN